MEQTLSKVNPKAIQEAARKQANVKGQTVSSFDSVMGVVGAMSPLALESTRAAGASPTKVSVLQAAFSSFPAAASAMAGKSVGYAPSFAGGFGGGMANQQVAGISGAGALGSQSYVASATEIPGAGGSQPIAGTDLSPYDLMNTMNQNNLQLIELQAIMQSNMQQWTTKSNVLSADHRAKMSLIEKFTARG